MQDQKTKCMVIGLDGVSQTLLSDYIEKGYLPGFKNILDSGFRLHQMDASIPDVSSTSWTSFMTGVNPGEHGIFGFMDLRPGTYKMFFPSSKDVKAPAIWEIIGQTSGGKGSTLHDKYREGIRRPLKSVVLNIPQTYPALPLNGVLTAGFVCPDLKNGTYPESAYNYLKSIGYLSDVDAQKAVEDRDAFFDELFLALDRRAEAFEHFMDNSEWDLFVSVITETDRLHHFFFDAARDEKNPVNKTFISFYKKMDEVIGRLYARFMEITGGQGLFITMSDHGFTVLEKEVYVNSWLREEGLLKINAVRDYYEGIEFGTKAFAMDPSRFYVNAEGRYPAGSVKGSDKKAVVADLKDRLLSLEYDGRHVIKAVYGNAEIYNGPAAASGPDLVCVANDGFDLKGTLKKEGVFGKGNFSGMHTRHDAHCILPASIEPGGRLHIEALAGFMLDKLLIQKPQRR
ncbi:MAG: alkaline phosphatase family protein [Deltaproteobacteria bacterium]|nr:alkaline phosphatase family protein [Deltaproteobacteria bacterium]